MVDTRQHCCLIEIFINVTHQLASTDLQLTYFPINSSLSLRKKGHQLLCQLQQFLVTASGAHQAQPDRTAFHLHDRQADLQEHKHRCTAAAFKHQIVPRGAR